MPTLGSKLMILISSTKLEHKIVNNELTQWEKTKYIIVMTAFYGFAGPIYVITPAFGPKQPEWNDVISFLSSVAFVFITYFGIKKCYRNNKTIDDADFIERFTILSVPMTIRFILLCLPALLLLAFILSTLTEDDETRQVLFYLLINVTGAIAAIIYYAFLNRSFLRLELLMKDNMRP
jgi:hypothetical protein